MNMEKHIELERQLQNIGLKFRTSDIEFPQLPIEYKKMLNDVGKIIDFISAMLMIYRYTTEEKQLKIRRIMASMEKYTEEIKKKQGYEELISWCSNCSKYTEHIRTDNAVIRCKICGHGKWY